MSSVSQPKTSRVSTDVLIIGAGAAGLRTAIELAENEVDCLVVGKRRHGDAHTTWAAGGINAALGNLDPADGWHIHAADTIREGHFINDPEAVETVCRHAVERVRELQKWGCPFDITDDGKINQRYFGAQSFRRTCFVADRTGEAILETLVHKARELGVPYRENLFVTRINVDLGRAHGAVAYDLETSEILLIDACAVVLAAAGYAGIFRRHTSRDDENTGDGVALAYKAGARLQDMEMVQFHPTGMVNPPDWRGRLVTEATRGEGGHLINVRGERFMERYAPDQMELAARDVVARAITQEILEGRGTENDAVYLDISHRDSDYIIERLPKLHHQLKDNGVDITREPVEVAPSCHYSMGGVVTNFRTGKTSVDGLYAVGEVTSGLHGANRLGGNSLIETLVLGKICGEHLAGNLPSPISPANSVRLEDHLCWVLNLPESEGAEDSRELIEELRRTMWSTAGIIRSGKILRQGLDALEKLKVRARNTGVIGSTERLEACLNLRFMLTAAEAVLRSALMREESRGAHYRTDHPHEDPDWLKNIVCQRDSENRMILNTADVRPVSDKVRQALDQHYELDYHHLE